jgi:hypothetical protein
MKAGFQPPSRFKFGGVSMLLCAFLFWKAHEVQAAWARIEAYPHEQAKVERTWVSYGKSGGRFADVSFGAGHFLSCRAQGLRVGPQSLVIRAGQYVEIVPRPGACDAPDVPGAIFPGWYPPLVYAFSFVTGLGSLMVLTGAWKGTPRSARAF